MLQGAGARKNLQRCGEPHAPAEAAGRERLAYLGVWRHASRNPAWNNWPQARSCYTNITRKLASVSERRDPGMVVWKWLKNLPSCHCTWSTRG